MSIVEAPARPATAQREPDPTVTPRQVDPPEGPDFPMPEPGQVGEPGSEPEVAPGTGPGPVPGTAPGPTAPGKAPDPVTSPGEPEPEPDGARARRMHGYVFEGYYYSVS